MLVELVCGFVLYKILRRFFPHRPGAGDVVEFSDYNALFSVATRLEKLYGGKAYVGLQIPDPDSGSRLSVDLVLVANGQVVVISVKNMAGFVSVNPDGSWVCITQNKCTEHHPNPVEEVLKQVTVLEAYLEQRGIVVPEGYLSYKVITPNPSFRTLNPTSFPPEVTQYDQWVQLKPEYKRIVSGWITRAFHIGKKEMKESINQQLHFVLSTAPIWDRLELKGSKYVLGEFIEFKGKNDDLQALQFIKRSKVGRVMIVQKTFMFGLAPSKLQVLYCPRDYRSEGAFAVEWKEITVRSGTEFVFQQRNSNKACKFKLSAVTSLTLSA